MVNLCVRSGTSTGWTPAGEVVTLDFSSSVGPGQQILAYAVALSGFVLDFVTTGSLFAAEEIGAITVSLVPQRVNNVIQVQANAALSDDGGDAAGSPTNSYPNTRLQVAALALIGQPGQLGNAVLANVIGTPNGQSLPKIPQRGNTTNNVVLSGFNLVGQNGTHEITSFNVGLSSNTSGQQLSGSVSCSATDLSANATVDALMLSATLPNVQIMQAAWSYQGFEEDTGISGTLSATFTVPANMTVDVHNVAVLLQNVSVDYNSGSHEVMLIDCYCDDSVSASWNGAQVTLTWPYRLNIYNPDAGVWDSYISAYSVTALVAVEFTGAGNRA